MTLKMLNQRPTPQLNERVGFVNGQYVHLGTVIGINPVRIRWDDDGEDEPWPPVSWPELLHVIGGGQD